MPLFSKYLNVADAKVFPQKTLQYCYEILSFYLILYIIIRWIIAPSKAPKNWIIKWGSLLPYLEVELDCIFTRDWLRQVCTPWQLVSFVDLRDLIFFTLCKHLYLFGTMSKRKISSSFQRQTAKIIDEAEEKTENWLHEAENYAWLSNSKPRNFQTKWLNEHNISKLNDSPDCYFDLKFYPSSPHALIFNTWRICIKELVM